MRPWILTMFLLVSGTSNASELCSADVIAALKNVQFGKDTTTASVSIFDSFCTKAKNSEISLAAGQDSGQLFGSESLNEACLKRSSNLIANAASEALVSTLPEKVQSEMVLACGSGGLLFTGNDDGANLVLTARFQQPSDGTSSVEKLTVRSLSVTDGAGNIISCHEDLSMEGSVIRKEGIVAKCDRSKNLAQLVAVLSTTQGKDNGPTREISFSGARLIEIAFKTPSVYGTDGREWTCVGSGVNYEPGQHFDCHWLGACDNGPKKVAICRASFGTHFELLPGGSLKRLYTIPVKPGQDRKRCKGGYERYGDICVIHEVPVELIGQPEASAVAQQMVVDR